MIIYCYKKTGIKRPSTINDKRKERMRIFLAFITITILFSCSAQRKDTKFVDGIQGAWNLAYYESEIDLNFYGLMVLFDADGRFLPAGHTEASLEFGKWQVEKVSLPDSAIINISSVDTLFAGKWTVKNFKFSKVKRYSSMMLYIELHQGNKVFILDRYSN